MAQLTGKQLLYCFLSAHPEKICVRTLLREVLEYFIGAALAASRSLGMQRVAFLLITAILLLATYRKDEAK